MRKFFSAWLLVWLIAGTGVFANFGGVIEVSPEAYRTANDMANNNNQLQVFYDAYMESLKAITVPGLMGSARDSVHITYLALAVFAHADIYATYRFSDGSTIKTDLANIDAISGDVRVKFLSAEDADGIAIYQKPTQLKVVLY